MEAWVPGTSEITVFLYLKDQLPENSLLTPSTGHISNNCEVLSTLPHREGKGRATSGI